MIKVSFDSNIYDAFLSDGDEFLNKIMDFIEAEKIEIYKTHIQDDELANIQDKEKRNKIDNLKLKLKPNHTVTNVGIWGISKWDQCNYGKGFGGVRLSDLSSNHEKHGRDALIALSAHQFVDFLVTNDKKLKSRCENNNIKVKNYSEFKIFVTEKLPNY